MKANSTKKETPKTRTPKAPDFIAWHVMSRPDEKAFWTRIGAAWLHDDGNGMLLNLELAPTSGGRVVLRAPKAPEQA